MNNLCFHNNSLSLCLSSHKWTPPVRRWAFSLRYGELSTQDPPEQVSTVCWGFPDSVVDEQRRHSLRGQWRWSAGSISRLRTRRDKSQAGVKGCVSAAFSRFHGTRRPTLYRRSLRPRPHAHVHQQNNGRKVINADARLFLL